MKYKLTGEFKINAFGINDVSDEALFAELAHRMSKGEKQ